MDTGIILKIAGIGIPMVAAGGFVFASVKWRLPSLIKRVEAIEEAGYAKRSELYEPNGETRYIQRTVIQQEIQSISASISSLNEGHKAMAKELAAVEKMTAVTYQRLDDFIKFHTKE